MYTTIHSIVLSLGIFVLGSIFGSFGAVLMERLAENASWKNIRSILIGRSICPQCAGDRKLARYELIPLFSRLRQGGTCTTCNSPIPTRYLRIEIASGIVFVMTYLRGVYFGIGLDQTIWWMVINRLLLLIFAYDLQTQYLHTPIRSLLIVIILAYLGIQRAEVIGNREYILASILIWGGLMTLIRRGASLYARARYDQDEGIGSGDVIIIATLAPLVPFAFFFTDLSNQGVVYFSIVQSFFWELIIAGVISLALAYILNRKKAGQTLAFLPGLIVARWILTRIAPSLLSLY